MFDFLKMMTKVRISEFTSAAGTHPVRLDGSVIYIKGLPNRTHQ